eukprot:gene20863-25019_t
MAAKCGFPPEKILTPFKAREEDFLEEMAKLAPDLCITAAYGNMLPTAFLNIPRYGTELLLERIDSVMDEAAIGSATPQDETAVVHAAKVAKEEGVLDFKLPAKTLHNKGGGVVDSGHQLLGFEHFLLVARTLNIHPSLLPKFRGAAPVQRAVEAGVEETGVSVAYTVLACDAGPVLAQRRVAPGDDIQAPELLEQLFTQ